MLDTAQDLANRVAAEVKGNIARYKNADFRDACMATCAAVAMADGVLQDEERRKVIACIQNNEALQVFSAADLRDIFVKYCDLAKDEFTKVELFKAIRKVKKDVDLADMVVKIGIIIAKSDQNFAEDEKKVLREIISTLELNEDDYNLTGPTTSRPTPAPTPAPVTITPAPQPTPNLPAKITGTSLKEVAKGERLTLSQIVGGPLNELLAGLSFEKTQPGIEFTTAVRFFNKDKQVLGEVNLQAKSAAGGGLTHKGNTRAVSALGDDEEVVINLANLAAQATSVLFVLTNAINGQIIKDLKSADIRLLELGGSNRQVLRFHLALSSKPLALVLARLYLHNGEWKFHAIGEEVQSQAADAASKVVTGFA
jgi:tellurite resistance protein/stress response protein SCP2